MKKVTITNTQKDRLWDTITVKVPESFEEILELTNGAEKGAMALINHALPIKMRQCKNPDEAQDYLVQVFCGVRSRSRAEKAGLINELSGHMDPDLLQGMTVKALRALRSAILD